MKAVCAMLVLCLMGCGKEGPKGDAGPAGDTGPAGPQGEQGVPGQDAGSVSFLLTCTMTLDSPINEAPWEGVMLTYQRLQWDSGDVLVTAHTAAAGTMNEAATAIYRAGMVGAKDGGITIGIGNDHYINASTPFALDAEGAIMLVTGGGVGGARSFGTAPCTKI